MRSIPATLLASELVGRTYCDDISITVISVIISLVLGFTSFFNVWEAEYDKKRNYYNSCRIWNSEIMPHNLILSLLASELVGRTYCDDISITVISVIISLVLGFTSFFNVWEAGVGENNISSYFNRQCIYLGVPTIGKLGPIMVKNILAHNSTVVSKPTWWWKIFTSFFNVWKAEVGEKISWHKISPTNSLASDIVGWLVELLL